VKSAAYVLAVVILLSVAGFAAVRAKSGAPTEPRREANEPQLTGVRLRANHEVLEQVRTAAATVRWSESRYERDGRLVLLPPPNYSSDDFGRLLQAIEPLQQEIDGLQLLGPHGGYVDDKGVEHLDD
jgi:hypothetical protein